MKHLRQRGLLTAFDALQRSVNFTSTTARLEHPSITQLHDYLVKQGDFDAAESLLAEIAYPQDNSEAGEESLFESFCIQMNPRIEWTRLDVMSETASWDGDSPSPRGGHQLVLVRPVNLANEEECPDPLAPSYTSSPPGGELDDGSSLYLFGGWDGLTELSDFWSFSLYHQRWQLLSGEAAKMNSSNDRANPSPKNGPCSRSCHQMAVDAQTGDIYLFGSFQESKIVAAAVRPAVDGISSASSQTSGSVSPVPASRTSIGGGTGGRRALDVQAPASLQSSAVMGNPEEIISEGNHPPSSLQPQSRPYHEARDGGRGQAQETFREWEALQDANSGLTVNVEDSDTHKADFWVYHTQGHSKGNWERLSTNTSVRLFYAIFYGNRLRFG